MRVCSQDGCSELVPGPGRCPTHTRQVDTQRGKTYERGYNREYVQGRKRAARAVATGKVTCWSCHKRISPLEGFHYGHCDDDRSIIHGAEHPACNLAHAGKNCPHESHHPAP